MLNQYCCCTVYSTARRSSIISTMMLSTRQCMATIRRHQREPRIHHRVIPTAAVSHSTDIGWYLCWQWNFYRYDTQRLSCTCVHRGYFVWIVWIFVACLVVTLIYYANSNNNNSNGKADIFLICCNSAKLCELYKLWMKITEASGALSCSALPDSSAVQFNRIKES